MLNETDIFSVHYIQNVFQTNIIREKEIKKDCRFDMTAFDNCLKIKKDYIV